MEADQVFINRWIDTTTMRHLHSGLLFGYKREENFIIYDSMDGPGNIILSEISQSEEEKYHMISLICEI